MTYDFLTTRREGPVEYVTLNRPDVRNAFNEHLGQELTHWAEAVTVDEDVRAVVMDGAGKVFCAGADLAWMAKMAAYSHEEKASAEGQEGLKAFLEKRKATWNASR